MCALQTGLKVAQIGEHICRYAMIRAIHIGPISLCGLSTYILAAEQQYSKGVIKSISHVHWFCRPRGPFWDPRGPWEKMASQHTAKIKEPWYGFWIMKQGKSEGFESCDRPIVRKRPIWVKIGDVLYRVTLKFDGWPWKTKGHLSFAVSSVVQHFIAIGEFKLELQSGNAQFGSNMKIFRAVWPWNLTDDLAKQ